jgi:hypothetical protein
VARAWELVGGRDTGIISSLAVLIGQQPSTQGPAASPPEAPNTTEGRPEEAPEVDLGSPAGTPGNPPKRLGWPRVCAKQGYPARHGHPHRRLRLLADRRTLKLTSSPTRLPPAFPEPPPPTRRASPMRTLFACLVLPARGAAKLACRSRRPASLPNSGRAATRLRVVSTTGCMFLLRTKKKRASRLSGRVV